MCVLDRLNREIGLEPVQLPIHQSSACDGLRCEACFMFRYRWNLKHKASKFKSSANLGTLGHRLLELGPSGEAIVRKEVADRIAELITEIEAGGDMFGILADEANQLQGLLEKAIVMVKIVWGRYPVASNVKVLAKEQIIDEVEIVLPSTGEKVKIGGILDEVLENTDSGFVFNKDHKLSSRDVMFTLTGYQYGLQCRLYRLLTHHTLRDPKGFILNILQVPSIKMCGADRDYIEHEHLFTRGKRKGEVEMQKDYHGEPTFENYLARCQEWYNEKGKEAAQSFSIYYNEPLIPAELEHQLSIVNSLVQCKADPGQFSRDGTRSYCTAWERVCEFYPLCNTSTDAWADIIENQYVQRER